MFQVAPTTPFLKYVDEFNAEKSYLINSYIAMRRCKRKLKGKVNFLFSDEKSSFPIMDGIKNTNKKLESHYWNKVISDTKIQNIVSAKEYQKWEETIKDVKNIPPFNKANVVSTVNQIYDSYAKFFAERVVYLFEKLSKKHVTNSAFGFGEKLILDSVHSGMSISKPYPSVNSENLEALTELRRIVAFYKNNNDIDNLLGGEGISSYKIIDMALDQLRENKKTEFIIDGGSIYLKIFKVGTMHIGIEPEIVEKMNTMLAFIYGNKIAESTKSMKSKYFYTPKKFDMNKRSKNINPKITIILNEIKRMDLRSFELNKNRKNKTFIYINSDYSKMLSNDAKLFAEFEDVINTLGFSVNQYNSLYEIEGVENFNEFKKIVEEIVLFNAMDEKFSNQQYYTNNDLSQQAYNFMIEGISEEKIKSGKYLEPSVGNGKLAAFMPKDAKLIDTSKLNCFAMKAKGYSNVINNDFIEYCIDSKNNNELFDFVLMNPPYTGRQDFNHTMSAIQKLKKGGVLVSIIPSSLRDSFDQLKNDGYEIHKSKDYENQFEDTKVTVFMIKVKKA